MKRIGRMSSGRESTVTVSRQLAAELYRHVVERRETKDTIK